MYICCVRAPHDSSKTTFGVPKNEEEKGKWEKALGMILKNKKIKYSLITNNSFLINSILDYCYQCCYLLTYFAIWLVYKSAGSAL